MLLIRIK